jgi:hypothetical protein
VTEVWGAVGAQVLVKRILETKAYYKRQDLERHEAVMLKAMANMSKYPNQVFKSSLPLLQRPHTAGPAALATNLSNLSSSSSLSAAGLPSSLLPPPP